jgi:hypothetical protein
MTFIPPFNLKMARVKVEVMVLNATFNNISAISWRSGLLVEETGIPGENHRHIFIT